MKRLEENLPFREEFIRLHRSYLTRLDKIEIISDKFDYVKIKGDTIPVSTTYRDELKERQIT